MYTTNCSICGQPFEHRLPSQHVCEPCKVRPCVVCGKSFKRIEPYDQKYCSRECRMIAYRDPQRNAVLTEKRKATLMEKYGVENISQVESVKSKIAASRSDPTGYYWEREKNRKAAYTPCIRKCVLCGEEFQAHGSQTICTKPHYKTCVICGKQFEYHGVSNKTQTCSRKCGAQLRKASSESHIN